MSEFRTLNRNIKLRILTVFLSVLLDSTILPNMAIYYTQYFGAAFTGVLLAIAATIGLVAGLYGGHLADVHGRKPIMLIGGGLMFGGYLLATVSNSALFVSPWLTFAGFLIARIGGNLGDPAAQAMIIDVSNEENRRFVYALLYWIMNISVMLGSAIGGWFFRDWLFELLLGLTIVAAINWCIFAFLLDETFQPKPGVRSSLWHVVRSYAAVLEDKRFMIFLAGQLAVEILFNQPSSYLPVHLARDFHTIHVFGMAVYGQRMLSVMTLVNTIMIVTLMAVMTRITKRWSTSRAYIIGTTLMGVSVGISFVLNTLWPLVIVEVFQTLGEMISVPPSQTLRADLMNEEKIGAYSGAFTTIGPLSSIIAGFGVTISTVIGNPGMMVLMFLMVLLSTTLVHKAIVYKAN
jgi:DHA1 family multidrug resistance protein B-like MFS transporter